MERPVPRRRDLLAVAVLVVGAGVLLRPVGGAVGDVGGGVLYAVLVVLLVAVVVPQARAWVHGAVGLALCVAVETAQLTGVPAAAAEAWPPARYVLGTTFHAPDLLAYAAGAVGGALLTAGLARRGARAEREHELRTAA